MTTQSLSLELAEAIIGKPMVEQLKQLANQASCDPVVSAQLLHNTLAKLDREFQAAAHVVWDNIISNKII